MTKPLASSDAAGLCPSCGGTITEIVYGLPSLELFEAAERGEVAIGGCVLFGNDPDRQCASCGQTWKADYVDFPGEAR